MSELFRNAWHYLYSDRGLAVVAILVGIAAILRAEWLFEKLYRREKYIKQAILEEANTVVLSYAAFSRAMQAVDLDQWELTKDGAFALFTCFHFQQLLHTGFTREEFAQLRKATRKQVDQMGTEYAELLVGSGLGSLKEGVVLTHGSSGNSKTP